MHITILAGGTSGAAFVGEFADLLGPDDRLSVIVNCAGDLWAHGLKVSPDLDLVLNTLRRRGYADTFGASDEIARLGIEPSWLRSSDRDLALHIVRTELLHAGFSLVQVAQALAARMDIAVDVIPMTNDRVEQHAVISNSEGSRAVHIAEFLANPGMTTASQLVMVNADAWTAAPEAIAALEAADVIAIAPGNAELSLAPIVSTPGIRAAIETSAALLVRVKELVVSPQPIGGAEAIELLESLKSTQGPITYRSDAPSVFSAAETASR